MGIKRYFVKVSEGITNRNAIKIKSTLSLETLTEWALIKLY